MFCDRLLPLLDVRRLCLAVDPAELHRGGVYALAAHLAGHYRAGECHDPHVMAALRLDYDDVALRTLSPDSLRYIPLRVFLKRTSREQVRILCQGDTPLSTSQSCSLQHPGRYEMAERRLSFPVTAHLNASAITSHI